MHPSQLRICRRVHCSLRRALSLCLGIVFFAGGVCFAQTPEDVQKPFDHATTGFDLFGAHDFVACESCHVGGQFHGTPRRCEGCHTPVSRFNATAKPVSHIHSSDQCDTCHAPTIWQDVPYIDHTQVFGACVNCHNNRQAIGKPPNHIPVHDRCEDCHSDMGFLPSRFNHDSIVGGCFNCHNGQQATGRPASHIPITAAACESCHRTEIWTPFQVDHELVLGACINCHNGAVAPGKSADHINSSNACDACHSGAALSWSPILVDHDHVVGSCQSCHNNVIARGQGPGHIPTNGASCDVCHTTDDFSITTPALPGMDGF